MRFLYLIDFKGHEWVLTFLFIRRGEAQWLVQGQPHELRNYPVIPTPIFTEWFSE